MNDFSISAIASNLNASVYSDSIAANINQSSKTDIKTQSFDQADFLCVASQSFKNLEAAKSMLVGEKDASQSICFWKSKVEPQDKLPTAEDTVKDKIEELMNKITSMLQDQKDK